MQKYLLNSLKERMRDERNFMLHFLMEFLPKGANMAFLGDQTFLGDELM